MSELYMKKQVSNGLLIRRSVYRSSRASCQPLQRISAPTYPERSIPWGIPNPPQMKGIPKHRLLVWGLESVPFGVCWKFLTFLVRLSMCRVSLPSHKEKAFSVTVASEGSIPFYVIILMLTLIGNHMFTGQGCLKLG